MYLDPHDPEVIKKAKENGIADSTIKSAQNSPIYKFLKEWKLALPLHAEFRTLPNLFYVPPLLPVMASVSDNSKDNDTLNPIAKALGMIGGYMDTILIRIEDILGNLFGTRTKNFPLTNYYWANLFWEAGRIGRGLIWPD